MPTRTSTALRPACWPSSAREWRPQPVSRSPPRSARTRSRPLWTVGPHGGSDIWDHTTDNLWVPDEYVKTGTTGFVKGLPRCDTNGLRPGGGDGGTNTTAQYESQHFVPLTQLQPGDMIFWGDGDDRYTT